MHAPLFILCLPGQFLLDIYPIFGHHSPWHEDCYSVDDSTNKGIIMDDKELTQLKRTVNTAIQKLEKLLSSLEVLCAWTTHADITDIKMVTQIVTIISSLAEFNSFSVALNSHLDACKRQFSRMIQIGSSETLTDDAIYALYYLAKHSCNYIRTNPNTEIVDAVNNISSLSPWERHREKVEFKDGTILLDRQLAVPKNLLEDAISSDNVARFCIGMNLAGKQLSFTLIRHLIAKRCAKILEHIVRNEKKLTKTISPANLLLTILIEWRTYIRLLMQVVAALEETYPGTIKSAVDVNGHNALWHTLHLLYDHTDAASEIGKYFALCGCDLDKPFRAGFSWNTMVRLMSIIKHHEQDKTNIL